MRYYIRLLGAFRGDKKLYLVFTKEVLRGKWPQKSSKPLSPCISLFLFLLWLSLDSGTCEILRLVWGHFLFWDRKCLASQTYWTGWEDLHLQRKSGLISLFGVHHWIILRHGVLAITSKGFFQDSYKKKEKETTCQLISVYWLLHGCGGVNLAHVL